MPESKNLQGNIMKFFLKIVIKVMKFSLIKCWKSSNFINKVGVVVLLVTRLFQELVKNIIKELELESKER
jgi:hypothetical protein